MEHRQGPQIDAVEGQPEAEAVAEGREIGAAVAVDDALRIPRRARGVEKAKRLPLVSDARPIECRIGAGKHLLVAKRADGCARCDRRRDVDDRDLMIDLFECRRYERSVFTIDDYDLRASVIEREGDIG